MHSRPPFRSFAFRLWLAAAVAITPSAAALAQPPIAPPADDQQAPPAGLDLRYATAESFAAIVARPRRVLTAPEMEMLPYEVLQAAGRQEFGIDPLAIEEVQVFVEPPELGPPQFLVVLRFAEAFDLDQLEQGVTQHANRQELDGRTYLRSRTPQPSFFAPDERTLLIGSDEMLQRAYEGRETVASSSLVERLTKMGGPQDLLAAVEFGPIRPLIAAQLQQLPPLPPALEAFKAVPQLVEAAEAKLDITGSPRFELVVYGTNEQTAEELEVLALHALELWQQRMLAELAQVEKQTEDAVERAMARYVKRISDSVIESYRPVRDGRQLVFFGNEEGQDSERVVAAATIGILVALLLPAVQAAREAARRTQAMNNMKQLMIALLNYESANGHFPPHAVTSEDGKPLLSWRVLILPYLEEQQDLYSQFRLDEPWDSEHNRTLIERMPEVFADPSSPRALIEHRSSYAVPYGEGLFMEGRDGLRMIGFWDGTSRTIALVEVDHDHAPIWTRPQDMEVDLDHPTAGLGGHHPGIFLAAFADGSVQAISEAIDPQTLKAMFTRAGAEQVER